MRRRLLPALVFLLGVVVLLYPSASQWFEQKAESEALAGLSDVQITGNHDLEQIYNEALAYNQALATGRNLKDFDYSSLLVTSPSSVMARLKIDSINLDQPIRHGMSEEVLTSGLGHLENTSLPVGGTPSNIVIGGHRGLAQAIGFTNLDKVSVGDHLVLETAGKGLLYVVQSTEVLEPGWAEIQPIEAGRDQLTLITCTPLGMNTHRIVVRAERILPTPIDIQTNVGAHSAQPGFPWWAGACGGALVVSVAYAAWPRKKKATEGAVG